MKRLIILLVLITVATSGCIKQTINIGDEEPEINSFEECAKHYPVMESYPPQCAVPGGPTFTEDNCQYEKGEDIFILTISDAKSVAKKSECVEVVCCEIYGYGVGMEKVNIHYQWTTPEDCTIPENFVGGGRDIVEDEYCGTGPLTEEYYCNVYTGTYWIDLDIEKEGCNPACVISVETRDAEINWRCTGIVTCAKEGEQFSLVYEEYPNHCCEELIEWHSGMDTRISIADECYETGLVAGSPVGICINCGNGICEDIEDPCNCPEDCIGKNSSDYLSIEQFCQSEKWTKTLSAACQEGYPEVDDLPMCKLC